MALTARLRKRIGVWEWRLRYWWLDTESGRHAHAVTFALALLVFVLQIVRMAVAALQPAPPPAEQKAVVWWVVQLIIALVAAIVSYVLRPRLPPTPTPKQESPTVEDGLCVDDHFGEVWIDKPALLAWKVVRTEKIKSKGGKK